MQRYHLPAPVSIFRDFRVWGREKIEQKTEKYAQNHVFLTFFPNLPAQACFPGEISGFRDFLGGNAGLSWYIYTDTLHISRK
jgi:hypothetical protein